MALVLGGDCETDHDHTTAWIAQWAISDGQNEVTGRNTEDFRDYLLTLLRDNKRVYLYFHNLKYDIEFIKYSLYEIQQIPDIEVHYMMRERNPIFVRISGTRGSGLGELHIRDSLKKFAGTVSDLAKNVGMKKLDSGTDFSAGWSNNIDYDNPKHWEYVKTDARIVARAMQQLHSLGADRSTSSGDAWQGIKASLGVGPDGKPYYNNYRWDSHFPKLTRALDKLLRAGYFGGINVSQHKGRVDGPITHIDVNSMYPAVMYYDQLPHGLPYATTKKPSEGKLYVIRCRIKLKLRDGKVPIFMFKDGVDAMLEGMKTADPVIETKEFHELILTNIDYDNIKRFYHIETDPDYTPVYFVFKSCVGLFREYLDHWQGVKNSSTRGTVEYHHSKFMQNQPYGRFALSPDGEETALIVDDNGDLKLHSERVENDNVDAYLPYAMFITAHARRRLCDGMLAIGCENIIHCDTDSIIYKGTPDVEGVDFGRRLGQWSIECQPVFMYEGGFKRYFEVLNWPIKSVDDISIACAGVPQRQTDDKIPTGMWVEILDDPSVITSDTELGQSEYRIKSQWLRKLYLDNNMDPDKVNTMKLIPVKVKGGRILKERNHKLGDIHMRIRMR